MSPKVERVLRYVLGRADETSTWQGVVIILTACGIHIDPMQAQAIGIIGVGVAGLLGALLPDHLGLQRTKP